MKGKISSLVAKMAIMVAQSNVNSSCPFISYQPKMPAAVKKLYKYDFD